MNAISTSACTTELVEGKTVFYRPDPGNYGPLRVITVEGTLTECDLRHRVIAHSAFKEMDLRFMSQDLCSAGELTDELQRLSTSPATTLYRAEKIAARLSCLAAAIY